MRVYDVVEVRRGADGALDPSLPSVLDAARGHVVLDVRSVPGEPDFDAPVSTTARLLVALLAGRAGADDVTVSSADWFAIEVARDAGLRTAFVTPEGLGLDGALAYVTGARHAEVHPHWTAVLEDPAAVTKAHDAGVSVVACVDDPQRHATLRDAGVDGVRPLLDHH